jgi:hypothetical protein
LNVQQLNEAAVRRDSRIDHLVEHLLYSHPQMLGRYSITLGDLGHWTEK